MTDDTKQTPVTPRKKKRVLKTVRNVAITVCVLLILMIGAGLFYTWYMGQRTTVIPAAIESPTETRAVIEPTAVAENVPVGASVQSLLSPVVPGTNTMIIVKTRPEANCKIEVVYDDIKSRDSGLVNKIADDFGVVSWTWTVEDTVPKGKWPVSVTCEYNKKSGFVQADLTVK